MRKRDLTASRLPAFEAGRHASARTRRTIAAMIAMSGLGCRTREDAALNVARESALAAAEHCAGTEVDACRASICHDRCAEFSDSSYLTETCFTRCMGRGTCHSDLDCDPARACVMIAPRLRRCEPRTDARPPDGETSFIPR